MSTPVCLSVGQSVGRTACLPRGKLHFHASIGEKKLVIIQQSSETYRWGSYRLTLRLRKGETDERSKVGYREASQLNDCN